MPEEPNGGGLQYDSINGYSIGFAVDLDKALNTRANDIEAYDNYIDTKDKFRVLFFTDSGDFLFGAIDRTVTYLTDVNDYTKDRWYVRVPVNFLVDRDGNVYDVEQIRKYLKEKPFRIAILANWPNEGKLSSDGGDDEQKNYTYINREPNWGAKNSYFYSERDRDLKSIHDLHHLVTDGNYSDDTRKDRPTNLDTYDFVMDNGKMGVKTDWVEWVHPEILDESKGDGRAQADYWIRNNYSPLSGNSILDSHYDDLWQLWDFDKAYRSNNNGDKYDSWGSEWYSRNGSTLKNWINRKNNNDELTTGFSNYDGLDFVIGNTTTDSNSEYYPGRNVGYPKLHYNETNSAYAIALPTTTLVERNNTSNGYYLNTTKTNTKGYFRFKALATGTLTIRFIGDIVVQKSTLQEATASSQSYNNAWSRDISITGEAEYIYIYNRSQNPAYIYSIEWVSNKYLYDTDRIGKAPSEIQPIPMYGVQRFAALANWEEGTTCDLTAESNPITLIRSLAKVVVYLQSPASYIYMRSMNRTARCEPIDVYTPTSETWKDHGTSASANNCEFWNIQKYGSGFNDTAAEPKDKSQLDAYTDWLSWFYYTWTGWNWNFYNHNTNYNSRKTVNTNTTINSPKIFYPDINRSDFCHMLYAGIEPGKGHKYILYMPEKNISDPNYPGITSSIAKVAHIEYRYTKDKMTEGRNFEDNNCKRIYFTDYSTNNTIKSVAKDSYETVYEKSASNLNNHWPIMRNHVYEFIVGSSSTANPSIDVSIKDWSTSRQIETW